MYSVGTGSGLQSLSKKAGLEDVFDCFVGTDSKLLTKTAGRLTLGGCLLSELGQESEGKHGLQRRCHHHH